MTEQEKQLNREKSSVGVKCEHAISGVKRYNAAKALYRNHMKDARRSLYVNSCRTLEFLPNGSISGWEKPESCFATFRALFSDKSNNSNFFC
ncbi:hypothetical protein [Okeania sp. SIO1I7]|uniref:hypothetical protein n=1 Tax=Okeania sp. SIO1I7 TaxID=2607772 RepID=UPI00260040F0|nr:hypothetical protein [Okeania sp. SIO1I7]